MWIFKFRRENISSRTNEWLKDVDNLFKLYEKVSFEDYRIKSSDKNSILAEINDYLEEIQTLKNAQQNKETVCGKLALLEDALASRKERMKEIKTCIDGSE